VRLRSFLAFTAIAIIAGCGGGNGGGANETSPNYLSGTLLDSPVGGIGFKTSSISGLTTATGQFKYLAGETITFFVGNIELPPVLGKAILTPLEIGQSTDITNNVVTNILVFLQSIDSDGNPSNGITVPANLGSQPITQLNFSLPTPTFLTVPALAALSIAASGAVPVVPSDAQAHFESTVISSGINVAPRANAGIPQNAFVGASVTLDGSQSIDVNGDTVTYSWSITSKPSGSLAVLSSANAAISTFSPDAPGLYELSLFASDSKGASSSATTVVSAIVPNSPPVAVAGSSLTVRTGASVTLNGESSSDPNGDQLTYSWSLSSKPDGSNAVLLASSSSIPTFTTDSAGTYVATLTVSDGKMSSAPSSVQILAKDPLLVTTPYLAANGLTVTLTSLSRNVLGNGYIRYTADIKQTNNTSTAIQDTFLKLWFANGQRITPSVFQSQYVLPGEAFSVYRTFQFDALASAAPTVWEYSSDWFASSPSPNSLQWDVPTNSLPLAMIAVVCWPLPSCPPVTLVSTTITIDGGISIDPDGDPKTYAWSVSKPSGSTALVAYPYPYRLEITPDVAGTYSFTLIVNDGKVNSAPSTISFNAQLP
jgi:hypothetical protein